MSRESKSASESRPIWRGHITFGLVQIPVVLHGAESHYDLHFRLLDSRDHARIRYERINEVTGKEVPWNDVVKAYEYDNDNYVVVSESEIKSAAVEATQTVQIEQFVDPADIDPFYYDKPYYLVPDKHGVKGYVLLREALKKAGKAGLARVVIRTRQYLCMLYVRQQALALMLLRFHQEIRAPARLDIPSADWKKSGIAPSDIRMAEELVASMEGTWKPEQYRDEFRETLMKWIEKKARAGSAAAVKPAREPKTNAHRIINITDLLERSLKQKRKPASRKRSRRVAPPRRRATA